MRPQTVEQAVREAHRILSDNGTTLAPAKVARLARDYVNANPPCEFAQYVLRNAAPSARSAPYARGTAIEWQDPTGDEAIANVMKSDTKEEAAA